MPAVHTEASPVKDDDITVQNFPTKLLEKQIKKAIAMAQMYLDEASDEFLDEVWTDESTVQLEGHSRFCCWKKGK